MENINVKIGDILDTKFYIGILKNNEWYFAGNDDSGPMSTGYPCWCFSKSNAKSFDSEELALIWFDKEKNWLADPYRFRNYDMSSICLVKEQPTVVKMVDMAIDEKPPAYL